MTGHRLLRGLTPVILWLYVACGVAPRAMVFAHHHHGDDHEHVHAWGADAVADDHDHADPDHDHPGDHQVVLEDDDHHRHGDHVHTQSPYPIATHTPVAALLASWLAAPLLPLHPLRPPARRDVPAAARGPPSHLV